MIYGIPVTAPANPERITQQVLASEPILRMQEEIAQLRESFIALTQEQYDALVAAGAVDESKYYVIVGGSE